MGMKLGWNGKNWLNNKKKGNILEQKVIYNTSWLNLYLTTFIDDKDITESL